MENQNSRQGVGFEIKSCSWRCSIRELRLLQFRFCDVPRERIMLPFKFCVGNVIFLIILRRRMVNWNGGNAISLLQSLSVMKNYCLQQSSRPMKTNWFVIRLMKTRATKYLINLYPMRSNFGLSWLYCLPSMRGIFYLNIFNRSHSWH